MLRSTSESITQFSSCMAKLFIQGIRAMLRKLHEVSELVPPRSYLLPQQGQPMLVNNSTIHLQRYIVKIVISKVFQSPIFAELENFGGGHVGCLKVCSKKVSGLR